MTTYETNAIPGELPDLVGQKIGNYRILSVIGRGSMGVVYRANDVALLRPTAIKFLHWSIQGDNQDPVKWFLAEARSIASLSHPGIVQVYNVASYSGHYLIAMEFVDGSSAEELLAKGPLSAMRATEILLQASEALQAAHARGIIHRDVKPPNLLVARDGQVKLTDFGLALTQLGPKSQGRIGTPFFTAPELWRGAEATPSSDIYSLGATFFRLLTGRHLFEATSLEELERLHLHEPPPDLRQLRPQLPPACAEVIARCVAKEPSQRFGSAGELTWAAAGLLNRIGSQTDLPVVGSGPIGPTGFSSDGDPIEATVQAGIEPFSSGLGFVRQPFTPVPPKEAPYQGEPFQSLGGALRAALTQTGSVVVVSGHATSGRTTVVAGLLAELSGARPVLYLDLERTTGGLLGRISTAVGAPPIASPEAAIRSLLRQLTAATERKRPYLIAIDGVRGTRAESELTTLAKAAKATSSFDLVIIAASGAGERLASAGLPRETISLAVQPLDGRQVRGYLMDWIAASLDPVAAPVIVTPDAGLLVAYWSGGILGEINRIATSALLLGARNKRRVITSQDVWMAAKQVRDPLTHSIESDTPTFGWPTADGLEQIISECRLRCGLQPRAQQATPHHAEK